MVYYYWTGIWLELQTHIKSVQNYQHGRYARSTDREKNGFEVVSQSVPAILLHAQKYVLFLRIKSTYF